MISIEKACKIIQDYKPNFRILGCGDYGDFYGFSLVPRRWNGNPEDLPNGGGITYTVDKKTGKIWYFYLWENHPEKKEDVDIYQYLSGEDANFAIKANKALDEYNNQECEVFTL